MSEWKTILRMVILLLLAGRPTSAQAPSGQQGKDRYTAGKEIRRPSAFSGLPVIGDFQTPAESPTDHERRQLREKRYSSLSFRKKPITDPGRLVDGQLESSDVTFIDTVVIRPPSDPPGIPASASTAVVIGTVVDGKCFLNSDHNFVYTDYQVRVDQVFKQDPAANLSAGDQVVVSKEGGAIRFPSGHITNFVFPGHGLPAIGSQYVLFLWRAIPSLPNYEIVLQSGYELKDGRLYPLDDANMQYEDMSESAFLDIFHKALAAANGGRP